MNYKQEQEQFKHRQLQEQEYEERIYTYFNEIPVVFRWEYNLSDIDVPEVITFDTLHRKKSG